MEIVTANNENRAILCKFMRCLHIDHMSEEDAEIEVTTLMNSKSDFMYLYKDNEYQGFIHLSIREDYVEGTESSPVVYVEGIYIGDNYRKKGVAKKLIEFTKSFAISRNIREIASDCYVSNTESEAFHKSCGFKEISRNIHFVMEAND